MTTKAELINSIAQSAAEYIGFPMDYSGLVRKNKANLERMALDYAEMVELQRKYRQAIMRYTETEILYFAIAHEYPNDYLEMREWRDAALTIWEKRY